MLISGTPGGSLCLSKPCAYMHTRYSDATGEHICTRVLSARERTSGFGILLTGRVLTVGVYFGAVLVTVGPDGISNQRGQIVGVHIPVGWGQSDA